MTEEEWLRGRQPYPLIDHLRREAPALGRGPVGRRKLRLFACACLWRIADLMPSPEQRQALETVERYADAAASTAVLAAAGLTLRRCRAQGHGSAYAAPEFLTVRQAFSAAVYVRGEAAQARG